MRKIYLPGEAAGSKVGYWEAQWQGVDLVPTVAKLHPSSGPLWSLLAALTQTSHLVLEAGCGSGVVVAYLNGLGRRVVGIDRATRALLSAKRQAPPLGLAAGDITRLPFRSESFDRVISLGAVEHIEEGAGETLLEHRRVLRPGGALLITVPRVGPVKRWNDFVHLSAGGRMSYRSRGRLVTRGGRTPRDSTFHQYEYSSRSFRRLLQVAGFRVRWVRPFMVGPGLGESRLVQRLARRRDSRETDQEKRSDGVEHAYQVPPPPAGFLSEALLHERGRGVAGRALTRLSEWTFGHMHFALAVKPEGRRARSS